MQVAEGLEVCHAQALFHGLLKPSNLMIGADDQLSILDFGIGCLLAETEGESLVDTMSTANSVASGLDCASPESIMDPTNLTPSGDQYSLGCVLYFCLTGQYPFPDGSSAEKMMAHQFKEPTPIKDLAPDVPLALIDVVKRLMQKAPENRYGSAADVVEALRPLADAPTSVSAPAARLSAVRAPAASSVRKAPPAQTTRKEQPALEAGTSVAPSTPTPCPVPAGKLPNREALRESKVPAPTPKPAATPLPTRATVAEQTKEREVPGYVREGPRPSWDERLGPVGIAIAAVVVCGLAWLLMWWLF